MKPITIILIMLALLLVVPAVSAETVGAYREVTLSGPSGILVPLGIERFVPLEQARIWYNWICIIIIVPLGCVASQRNYERFAVFIPIVAAILVGFGWLRSSNMVATMGLIIGLGLLGAAIYMKGSLRQTSGMAGPGSPLVTLAIYMIVLGAVFGLLNSPTIWGDNTNPIPSQYSNVDLGKEIPQMNNAGGTMDDIVNLGTWLLTAGWASLKILLSIIGSIACFTYMLTLMFPFLKDSALAIGILAIFQFLIYFLYAKFAYDVFYARSIYAVEF
jgi:hypothetical protein